MPENCLVQFIFPVSPAERAGLQKGDRIVAVDGKNISAVDEFLKFIPNAQSPLRIEGIKKDGSLYNLQIALNPKPPRLGIRCDMTGVQNLGSTQDGRPYINDSQGSLGLTASISIANGISFARLNVGNYSDHSISVSPFLFKVADGSRTMLNQLSPLQVMQVLHGDVGARVGAAQAQSAWASAAAANAQANATYTTNASAMSFGNYSYGSATTSPDAGSQFASSFYSSYAMGAAIRAQNEVESAEQDSAYFNKESLRLTTIEPSFSAEGLIYFPEPHSYPVTLMADIEGNKFSFQFDHPSLKK